MTTEEARRAFDSAVNALSERLRKKGNVQDYLTITLCLRALTEDEGGSGPGAASSATNTFKCPRCKKPFSVTIY